MENREKFLEQQVEEIQKEQTLNIEKSKRKRKVLGLAIISVVLSASAAFTAFFFSKKQNNSKNNKPTQSMLDTTPTINPEDQISVNGLGLVYDDPTLQIEKPQYGNTTGNINKEDLVEKNNTIWKDQEAANNSSNVGKTEIDDKKGTLEVKPNGDVFVKDEGYEIKKEDGTTVEGTITEQDKQNGNKLPGYVYDENLDKEVIPEHANKYVSCDANYYDSTGALVYAKGEAITPEDLALAKQLFTTTKPVIETQPESTVPETKPEGPIEEEIVVTEQGVVNADGTYTIFGLTFESKADYEQWVIQGFEGYGIDLDGIMKPEEEIKVNYNQKTK